MDTVSQVSEHKFDKALLEQIDTLRTIRLTLAETMLRDMRQTAMELERRGLVDHMDADELRRELTSRVATLRQRLAQPDIIYSDEIDLCAELTEAEPEDAEA